MVPMLPGGGLGWMFIERDVEYHLEELLLLLLGWKG